MSLRDTLLLAAGLLLTGCYKIDYVAGPSEPVPAQTEWHHIGIFGLAEFSEPIRLDAICPQGFARVENRRSFLNGLATLGVGLLVPGAGNWIYQPYTTTVYCKSGQGYRVELNDDGFVTMAEPIE